MKNINCNFELYIYLIFDLLYALFHSTTRFPVITNFFLLPK